MTFKFTVPKNRKQSSEIANLVLRLSSVAEQLSLENRTLINHIDGRPENVAEHSLMLALLAPVLAEEYYPKLDSGLVSRYAVIHDIAEAYVGDTPTHDFDKVNFDSKQDAELLGLKQLAEDFRNNKKFIKLIHDYEAQEIAEARFVRVVDKILPVLSYFLNDGYTLKKYDSTEKLLGTIAERNAYLRRHYPEFEALIKLREELAELTFSELISE